MEYWIEEEDVTAVPAKARLISQLSNQATVQTKREAGMGVIEDMYKARTRFNNYCVKKKKKKKIGYWRLSTKPYFNPNILAHVSSIACHTIVSVLA